MVVAPRNQTYFLMLEKLASIDSADGVQAFLRQVIKLYELRHIAYLAVNMPGTPLSEPYLEVTYSLDWVEHYKARRFVDIDPAIRNGFIQMLPFDWGQFSNGEAKLKRFFGEASEFGIGKRGLTIPLRGRRGERALFSITSDLSAAAWEEMRVLYMRDFQVLAMLFHEMVLRLQHAEQDDIVLSSREVECLIWTAEGKSAEDCATILNLSDRTVRAYLENARKKLNVVTTTQAVAKALNYNLLMPRL
ncbi:MULTISPECIES: helix-turn-helix transcriptional regulator [unclassified Aureimonas]|uniref:helix-turn-helix transcriptional regulator n=1 Tax=unclassified Aureimonas TaxID=2615206 RepID=UPI0006F44B1A|nr:MULTISPECIES: LuxR family transcriptional regulator [unclassified Aureimonas]KQT62242.1 hypothetical protein ASG62_23195 [Aureimonas sp. Leaf427]KQT72522.1 hypothetical protein ASG54_18370 [Aureimonas sp. Leaf460]